jgi:hypothetical protein
MAAVVFTKFRGVIGALEPQVLSKYCLCTSGTKLPVLAKVDCSAVPPHLFRETLKDFVTQWDTKHLPSEAVKREVPLWLSFLNREGENRSTTMAIRRPGCPDFFEAEIFGDMGPVERALDIDFRNLDLDRFFDNEMKRLQEMGLEPKKAVEVSVESGILASPVFFQCDTTKRYTPYVENSNSCFNFLHVDPLAPKLFSLAPTVEKMRQIVNSGNVLWTQDFSEGDKLMSLKLQAANRKMNA